MGGEPPSHIRTGSSYGVLDPNNHTGRYPLCQGETICTAYGRVVVVKKPPSPSEGNGSVEDRPGRGVGNVQGTLKSGIGPTVDGREPSCVGSRYTTSLFAAKLGRIRHGLPSPHPHSPEQEND